MSILKELTSITDPTIMFEANVPVELKAIVDAFPKHHGKAFQKLWGGNRLMWHGMPFFANNELGDAYVKAEEAAEAFIADGYNTDARIDISGEVDGNDEHGDVSWDVEFEAENKQECYLGYDPTRDALYIGFDAWSNEDEFHTAFDEAFQETWGVPYDSDNEEHAAIFSEAWAEYKEMKLGFWGLIFEITVDGNNEMTAEEALPPMTGGFYSGTFKLFKQNHPNVINLRLD